MSIASGLARGLAVGSGIGFGLAASKRRNMRDQQERDRQAILDQRYNDQVERQKAETKFNHEMRQKQFGLRQKQFGLLQSQSNRANAAEERQQQLFDMKMTEAKRKQHVQRFLDVVDAMKAGVGVSLDHDLNSTPNGKKLMQSLGLKHAELHPTDNGDGTRSWWVVGSRDGKDWGVITPEGGLTNGDENTQPMTQAGLLALASHVYGVAPDELQSAVAQSYRSGLATKKEYAKGRQKHADEMDLQRLKNDGKAKPTAKAPSVTKQDIAAASKILERAGVQSHDEGLDMQTAMAAKRYLAQGMNVGNAWRAAVDDAKAAQVTEKGTLWDTHTHDSTKFGARNKPAQAGSGLPPQAAAQLKEGHNTKFGNGQVWTLQNGHPVRVQ